MRVQALLIGFLLDCLLGDPVWLYHPVQAMGWLIERCERLYRKLFIQNKGGEILAGGLLAVTLTGVSYLVPWASLRLADWLHAWGALAMESIFCWLIIAPRSLRDESAAVYHQLKKGDLVAARQAVSRIVGRDTAELTAEEVTKATVETIAENTSDGVVAPLVFLALGGAPLGFLYKAINTMDSMVGYKNEKYLYFGRIPARLDDLANFLPARLSGWLMIVAAYLLGFDGKNAKAIYRRDRRNHASPNSAHTEAACAGALDIQLAGPAVYFGVVHNKPTLGDPIRPVEPEDIPRAHKLLYGTTVLALLLAVLVAWLLA